MRNTPPGAARPGGWGRGDAALFALAPIALVLIAVQFALARFRGVHHGQDPATSRQHAYGAHAVLGLVTAALTLLILGAALASQPARAHRRTLWLTVTLAVLSAVALPLLDEAGKHMPAAGALHALNGLIIFAATWRLTWETTRCRAASQAARTAAAGPRAHAPQAPTDLR